MSIPPEQKTVLAVELARVDAGGALSNGTPPNSEDAAVELAGLLGLPSVGLAVTGARIVGRGSRASADLSLSDDTTITFDSLRDFANPRVLAVEVTACTGATPALKPARAQQALALLRQIAEHHDTTTADDIAIEWGVSYLQSSKSRPFVFTDQGSRWEAFCALKRHSPTREVHSQGPYLGGTLADGGLVLVDGDGTRYVRCGWFYECVRSQDASAGGHAQIAQRMERVGWKRRGKRGRIKATCKGFQGDLHWSFFVVAADWEAGE